MSSEAPKQKCPNCGTEVDFAVIECPYCGTNVKSGETFDMKVKRAQIKEEHGEKYVRHVFLGVALIFALIIMAGFFTQRGAEEFIKENPEEFRDYAEKMNKLDRLITAGRKEEAKVLGEELIRKLEKREETLKEGPDYEKKPTSKAKKFLANLRKKVQHKLEQMNR